MNREVCLFISVSSMFVSAENQTWCSVKMERRNRGFLLALLIPIYTAFKPIIPEPESLLREVRHLGCDWVNICRYRGSHLVH